MVDCLQSAFSLKIRLVLDLIQRDCKPRCYYIGIETRRENTSIEWRRLSRFPSKNDAGSRSSTTYYYVAVSASWQGEANSSLIGYPSGQDGLILPGFTSLVPQKSSVLSHIINPLLTKLVRSGWLNIGLVLYCFFPTSISSFSIKTQKRTWPKMHMYSGNLVHVVVLVLECKGL